jgi:hypothetical protein
MCVCFISLCRKVASSISSGPVDDSASNINEYQDYFLGGKGDRFVRLTTFMCRLS